MTDAACPMCGEAVPAVGDVSPTQLYADGAWRQVHRSCMLREVLGGIGHLIAHDYWCTERHDPDAGLTRRQSALLAAEWQRVVGLQADGEPPVVP